ncbi:diguanylate cyclase domain-containing protein [Paenibacillus sp. SAF-054]|uniref:diguanylate cyclase domain-containing protein n=2 Tax=unclassified Paenibacillus TaxID=185978 RepID=UPI003F7EB7B4
MTNQTGRKEKDMLNRTLLTEGDFLLKESINLTNCDKEPIHIPGRIQPHGMLLAVTLEEDHKIVQCSINVDEFIGISSDKLLGMPVAGIIGQKQQDQMLAEVQRLKSEPAQLHYMNIVVDVNGEAKDFYGILHESDNLIILEMEPATDELGPVLNDFEMIQSFFGKMKQTDSRVEASMLAAEQIKEMLDYDRVIIYEFDEQWNGKVIAEAKEEELETYLGHYYPASDIPKQARELYLRNWLRTIVDINYTPVDIVPTLHPLTGKPLNLSLSTLRSVSPVHIEYMKNMGVGATLTISLIHENKLWGMIACHHYSKKYVTHRVRNLCNFLGAFFSSELYQREQLDDFQSELSLKTLANRISSIFIGNTSASRVMSQIREEEENVLALMDATGAAVNYQGQLTLLGITPSSAEVRGLAAWMSKRLSDYAYHSSCLSIEYEPARLFKKEAAGAMFMSLSPDANDYIVWFRPEVIQVVNWAGDPEKAVVKEGDLERLSPRKSFEQWKHTVESTSLPWKAREMRTLSDLKAVVLKRTENQMRQAEEQAKQNARIMRENEKRYLQLMDMSPVAFFAITDGNIMYVNQQTVKLFHAAKPEDMQGQRWTSLADPDSGKNLRYAMIELEHSIEPLVSTEEYFTAFDGTVMQLEVTMAHVIYANKPSIFAIAREKAIAEKVEADFHEVTGQLESFVYTDTLTDVPSRRYFEKSLSREWEQCRTLGAPISVIMLDIDNFSTYNMLFGVQGADTCLQWIADVLNAFGRPKGAVIARFQGGTFAVHLTHGSIEKGLEIAEQIRQAVLSMQIPLNLSDASDYMTISLGVSSAVPHAGNSSVQLINEAEKALMKAKHEGRNRVAVL